MLDLQIRASPKLKLLSCHHFVDAIHSDFEKASEYLIPFSTSPPGFRALQYRPATELGRYIKPYLDLDIEAFKYENRSLSERNFSHWVLLGFK